MKYLISILITNYNKSKYLNKNLNSIFESIYPRYEVILFDDCSDDNSIKIIQKYKKVKLIKNKFKKFKSPALNQIYGLKNAFEKSKGEIICLLDADDCFKKNKLKIINNFFTKHLDKNTIFNFPKLNKTSFKLKEKASNNIWPSIFPTSCISTRRNNFQKFLKFSKTKSFPNLEVDARFIIYSKFYTDDYNFIKSELTIYNFDPKGITSKIQKFSKKWWYRRYEAFKFLNYILHLKKRKLSWTLDRILTLTIYNFLNFFKNK